jgi:membrane protease YdiL (CAAX protease family)
VLFVNDDERPMIAEPMEADCVAAEGEPAPNANHMLTAGVVFEGGLGLLAIALGWLLAQPVLEAVRWDVSAVLWGVAATLPMLALLLLIERWPAGPLRGLKQLVDESLVPMFKDCRWWHLAVLSILAGWGEELLFRGLIQASLVEWIGVWPAVLVAGIVFGLAHPLSKSYVIVAAAIGAYLGWVFVATENLLAPIIAHGLYDFIALVYLTRAARASRILQCHNSRYTDAID